MVTNENQILFPGKVKDVEDPMCLGRIRVEPLTELANFPQDILGKYAQVDVLPTPYTKWSKDDPYVFLPLLPFHFYNVPKKDEYVSIIYQDKDFRRENQFYIPGPISSPMNIKFENLAGAISFLGLGSLNELYKPLKKPNGQYNDSVSFGIFPEPGDISVMGRGSTDLVLKENEVLLRAGKTQTKDLSPFTFPSGNDNRAFIQLSNFTQTKVAGDPQEIAIPRANVSYVRKMIMWDITNWENTEDKLTGRITLHNINPTSSSVNTASFKLGTILDLTAGENYGAPLTIFPFFGKSTSEVADLINSIANSLFDGKYNVPNYGVQNPEYFTPSETNLTTPFVITPSPESFKKGLRNDENTSNIQDSNELQIYLKISSKIQIKQRNSNYGFLLVSGKSADGKNPILGQLFTTKSEIIVDSNYFSSPITYGVMGAQKLYLLSQDSEGPKGKISLKDTLYGVPQSKFVGDLDSIENLSYPMVRGDKLIELLNKIILYLTTHVHPFFGMPPVPSPELEDLLKTIAESPNTVLNQNIRIN